MPIIQNPTAGDVHVNTPLTNFSQKWMQDEAGFVSLRAAPNLPVEKQSDLYYEFSREDFFRDEARERADGAESAGGGFTLSTSPYFAHVYAFHKDVTDRQRANQDSVIRLDQSAAQFVTQKLLIRRERVFQERFFPAAAASGIWANELTGAGSTPGATEFLQWNVDGSDPIVDVRNAIEVVHAATGLRPNRAIFGRPTWNVLLDNDAILARIEGGATRDMPAIVMRQLIAALFELEEIFVMDGVVNSALKGEAESTGFIGGDNALIYHAPSGMAVDQPTAMAQFSWTGLMGMSANGMRIKRFRWEAVEGDRIEGQMAFDYKVTAPELGFYFHDCKE